jgi:uncharacterized protein
MKTSIKRSLQEPIEQLIKDKIILLSGPRQVGKTYFSKKLKASFQYLNFDLSEDRDIIKSKSWLRNGQLLILDEIHKLKNWKRWIKGIYDTEKGKNLYLLTGSSRLDIMKKAGDSLAGRHYSFRLNPLSIKEVSFIQPRLAAERMLKLGSFPEPFLSNSEIKAALWRKSHLQVIVKQDLVELESVRDILSIELLIQALKKRVGQQIVYSNLANELGVSPHTIKKWIQILESLFVVFVVYPYTKNVLDAVKKEPKIYFYDLGQVQSDEGFKIENLVALHLLKRNQFLEDTEGKNIRLCYIRDKKKREIDFVIEQDNLLTHLIEVKKSDDQFNLHLNYYSDRLKPQFALQLVWNLKREKDFENHSIKNLVNFLSQLET